MKIFITGATGYVGSAIATALIRARHDVTALVRSPASAARVRDAGIVPVRGDLLEPASWRDTARAADAIVHAGVESGTNRIGVDRLVLDAIAGPNLIYTSVMFVLGNVENADETTPAGGPRAEHERIVLEAGGAVIRPGMIWGEDAWLFENPITIGDGSNRWPLVHRDDVGELYRLVVESGARGVFHAVAEVIRAADVFPGHEVPLEEARKELGGFADALALDQDVTALRSVAIGWKPTQFWKG
ncbi:MAG TPA: NAD-dependent epimerase/dehydratase family protein [Thermoanaerobaculia bacterium]|nr:NAD-dependent epimerase/dehydratase family protein [Thermoanaerobaculia bacterium]